MKLSVLQMWIAFANYKNSLHDDNWGILLFFIGRRSLVVTHQSSI